MTHWTDDVEAVVRQALREVEPVEANREHLGRPFITVYQLAIKVNRIRPEVARDLGLAVGGEGVDRHRSLTSYLAAQLSRRIKAVGAAYDIEGARLSAVDMTGMFFRPHAGTSPDIKNSNVPAGYDTTMFRIRDDSD